MPSKSKSQKRLMDASYAYLKGETKDIPENIKNVAMSFMKKGKKGKKSLRDFTKTKNKNLPEKLDEKVLKFSEFI